MSLLPANRTDELWWANERLRNEIISNPEAILKDRGIAVPGDMPMSTMHEFIRVTHLLWVEGQLVPVDRFFIDPSDEGLLLGKGVWESTKTVQGEPWLWNLHLDRLLQSARVLGIVLKPERLPSAAVVKEYVRCLTTDDVLIRLNVTAGRPGKPGLVWMSAAPLAIHPASVRLRTVRNPVQKGQAYLTLKTFQYATRLQLGLQVAGEGYDSALLLDDDDNMQEAAHANLFVRLPEGWATPTADGGLLPGTVRQLLIDTGPVPIAVKTLPIAKLNDATEVFVTNSNAGIVPVTKIDAFEFPIGPETKMLQMWLATATASANRYLFVNRAQAP